MDSGIAWFLLYHCIYDLAPAAEAVAMAYGVLKYCMVSRPDGTSGAIDFLEVSFFRYESVGFKQRVVV